MELILDLLFLYIAYQILIACLQAIISLIVCLLELLCELAVEIWFACWEKFWLLLEFLCETLAQCCVWTRNKIWTIVIFFYFLVAESLGGNSSRPNDHDQETETEDHLAEQEALNNAYAQALTLLGLQAGCTRKILNVAFKKAMETAHPDKGGTHEKALEVNAARNIIKTKNGWR